MIKHGKSSDFFLPITRICYFLKNSILQTRGGESRALILLTLKPVPKGTHQTLPTYHFSDTHLAFSPPHPLVWISLFTSVFLRLNFGHIPPPPECTFVHLEYCGNSIKYVIETISRSFTTGLPWDHKGRVGKVNVKNTRYRNYEGL